MSAENLARSPAPGANRTLQSFELSPIVVFFEITQACDLACVHCRAAAQPFRHPGELSRSDARLLVHQLKEFPQPPRLVITGGDPFKRCDLFELVSYASEQGLRVSVTPSATPLVTHASLRRLRDAGIERVAVSLDGADAATHDNIRGIPGSYRQTLDILSIASQLGIATQVNTTVTPTNWRQIDDLAELLARQGIEMWSVFFLVPVGRARSSPRLEPPEYEIAFERLWQNAGKVPYAIKTTEAPHFRRFVALRRASERGRPGRADRPEYASRGVGVNDGNGVMFVSHTGAIYPSGFLPVHCGRFPQDHIVTVYQRSSTFQTLRNPELLQGKCGLCEFRRLCGGGRARAYAVTGDLMSEEPDCTYIPRSGPCMTNTMGQTG